MTRTLTSAEARRYYNRFANLQDKQGWYENAAIDDIREHADFGNAQSVFEFGCGAGKLAAELLKETLPASAQYLGVDISPVMVEIARKRLTPFAPRAEVLLSEGGVMLEAEDAAFDRFICCYVFDLLSCSDIDRLISEAHRVLAPGGLICIASLTPGPTFLSRIVSKLWSGVHRINPMLVGGCRPVKMPPKIKGDDWVVRHRRTVTPFAIPSEVVIAERRANA